MNIRQKDKIQNYMLQLIQKRDGEFVAKTLESFDVAKSTVYNYLKELLAEGIIEKRDKHKKGEPNYYLVTKRYRFNYDTRDHLAEDRIFDQDIASLLNDLDKDVFLDWRYAFTEMMNNAIEHSEASAIMCLVMIDDVNTRVAIIDDGIGIFKNIQRYLQETKNEQLSLEDCTTLLFAGKFTTRKDTHTGEGIFFTSHLMDQFLIASDGVFFARDNFNNLMVTDVHLDKGTCVIMQLSNHSRKKLQEVFNRFSDADEGFFRTQIPLIHIFPSAYPVSRSEARRLGGSIQQFKEVTLDFNGIESIGQAFAHEFFVVLRKQEPQIEINIENANEAVQSMIRRVQNTK